MLILILFTKQPLSEHVRVLVHILESPLNEFLCELLIRALVPQEVRLVIAVEGRAELAPKVMGEAQRSVGARGLGVQGQALLIELDG